MGDSIKYEARTAAPGGAALTLSYMHDPKGKPSRVGIIATSLASGTQTGSVSIRYGNSVGSAAEIGNGTFTAADPSVVIHPNFVIHPGQVILAVFSSTVTAGDICTFTVGGH